MPDLSKLAFYSDVNYLKRSEFCGHTTVTLPAYGGTVEHSIDHNLGYVPFYQVYSEIDTAGVIWAGGKVSENTDQAFLSGSAADTTYPEIRSWITDTTLTIQLINFTSPTATGTRELYWLIYKDYPA